MNNRIPPKAWRLAQLVLLLAACVMSTGCTKEIVGMVDGLDLQKVLFGDSSTGYAPAIAITRLVSVSAQLARTAGGAFIGLMCLYSAYKAMMGQPWLEILKSSFLGAALFGYIVTFAGSQWGLERMIYQGGVALGERFANPEPLGSIVLQWSSSLSSPVVDAAEAVKELGKGQVLSSGARVIESVLMLLSQPYIGAMVWVNNMGVWLVKIVMHTLFGFMMGLHVILLPLAALALLYPPIHYIFTSFMKSFGAMALLPMLFAVCENLVTALPMGTVFNPTVTAGAPSMTRFLAGQLALAIVNISFFTFMTGMLGFAYLVMFGAIRPPRTGILSA